jgi:hypothetical protein
MPDQPKTPQDALRRRSRPSHPDRGPRPGSAPATGDTNEVIDLLAFEWVTPHGIQPVILVERRLLD